jgi:hypothetical protein
LVDALITVLPVTADEIVALHDPLPPEVMQFCDPGTPGPAMIVTVQVVPSGAGTGPVPSFTVMWQVRVWFERTRFVAAAGVIWMFASTTRSCSQLPSEAE